MCALSMSVVCSEGSVSLENSGQRADNAQCMVKWFVLLMARWANQVVQDRRWSGYSAAGLCGGW